MGSDNPHQNEQGTPLSQLPQLTVLDRAVLAVNNITTVEEFLKRQIQDPKLIHHVGLPDWKAEKRLAEALEFAVTQRWVLRPQSEKALATAQALNDRWLRTHWPDISVLALLLFLSMGAYRGCSTRAALAAPHGLMPYQLIAASDVTVRGNARNQVAAVNEIAGRYSTVRVPPGGEINPFSLSSRALPMDALDHRRILRLALQPSPLVESLRSMLPAKVSLMVAPKDKDAKGMLLDSVYILDVEAKQDGVSAVLALSETDAQALAGQEARSELIIMGPIH